MATAPTTCRRTHAARAAALAVVLAALAGRSRIDGYAYDWSINAP